MYRWHAFGPLILNSVVFAFALMMSEPPAWPPRSGVKIGGPFTLATPNARRSPIRLSRQMVLVYFGYTSCPNSCPTTLSNRHGSDETGLGCFPN